MRDAFDAFIGVLEHIGCSPRVTGMRAMALCPAHTDREPSLSVGCGGTGRVLVHCFAGCETQSILDALGATWKLLFADDGWPEGGVIHHYRPDPESLQLLEGIIGAPISRLRGPDPDRPRTRITMPTIRPRRVW